MGGGGRMISRSDEDHNSTQLNDAIVRRVPVDKPPFTLSQLKKSIPPHCLHRSVLRSFSFVFHDLFISTILLLFALYVIPSIPFTPLRLAAWPLYWIVQGCVLTGVWVIAHECGHHAFSDYSLLDDIVGLILHSCLMVPYFSWKYSHRRHHSNAGSLDRDEVFVPKPKSQLPWFSKYLNNPLGRFLYLFITLTLGWPLYLAFNFSGRPYPRFACHFDPYSPIYSDRERAQIFISDAGILTVSFFLYRLATSFSLLWLIRIYILPLLVVNTFLVPINYLAHTHPALPHYGTDEWDWLRGALATVDRDKMGKEEEPEIERLPVDILAFIFSLIPSFSELAQASAVCRKWKRGVEQSLAQRERLSLSGFNVDDDIAARIVHGAYGLKELDISRSCWRCKITDEGLYKISLAKCVANLTSISMWGMARITDKGVIPLVSEATSLCHLNVGGTFITDESLFAIANSCPNLKAIVLWSCRHVTETGLIMLVNKCRKLESINVWGMRVPRNFFLDLIAISPALQIKPPSLHPKIVRMWSIPQISNI